MAGRPTKFSEENQKIALVAYKFGATDVEVAEELGVSEKTINNWKEEYPQFFQSIKDNKEFQDNQVEQSLLKRAKGFSRKVQKIDKDGCIHDIEEELPPDPTSMIFWLKNRQPKKWRDKQEHELSGKDGAPLTPVFNITVKKTDSDASGE